MPFKSYIMGGLAFLSVFLFALLKGQKAAHEKERADREHATRKLQERITNAYVEGQKKYKEKVNQTVKKGHFS